jgi:hypothetical protein
VLSAGGAQESGQLTQRIEVEGGLDTYMLWRYPTLNTLPHASGHNLRKEIGMAVAKKKAAAKPKKATAKKTTAKKTAKKPAKKTTAKKVVKKAT